MSFPRYPAYRMTGIDWLPEVPSHWDVLRLKQACDVFPSNVDKKSVAGERTVMLCNYTDVYYNDRIGVELDFMVATATEDQIERFTLRAGDTIVTKDSETADDIAVSAFVPANLPGVICGYHLSVVRPIAPHSGAFVKRLFDSAYAKACVAVRANGLTRVALGQYDLDNLELPFPPSAEQEAIAAFLDRETAKIDELVEEQRRLIALLDEKRQAVISQAISKGLNPGAPLKASRVGSMGEIPLHWEVLPLKRDATMVTSGSRGWAEHYADDGALFLRIANLTRASICLDLTDTQRVSVPAGSEGTRTMVQPGDVLFSITADLGSVAVVPHGIETAFVSQHLALARLKQARTLPRWVGFVALSAPGKAWFAMQGYGGAKVQLSLDDVREMPVPTPPLTEQLELVAHIEHVAAAVDSLAGEALRAIELLLERRSALITAAVTGQIDVRALAPTEAP